MNGTLAAVTALLLTGLPVSWVQLYRIYRLNWVRTHDDPAFSVVGVFVCGTPTYVGLVWLYYTTATGLATNVQLAFGVPAVAVALSYILLLSPEFREYAL